jgi:hypothetical protein
MTQSIIQIDPTKMRNRIQKGSAINRINSKTYKMFFQSKIKSILATQNQYYRIHQDN